MDIDLDEAERRSGYDQPAHEPDQPSENDDLVVLYGDDPPEPPPWLIKGILPAAQVAVVAGQYSAGKTFVVVDISHCVMTGEPFLGFEVAKSGGVLWLAAEGQSEIMIRVKAAAVHRTGADMAGQLPFVVQAGSVPKLTDPDAASRLLKMAMAADNKFEPFGVELALIVIDTLNSAAGFQDENNASETQRVFDVLRGLSRQTGALVVVVDHFGKMLETGIRGSSAKGGAADAILAVLADKTAEGDIRNRRLVVEKLRQAPSGRIVPFELVSVPTDAWGNTVGAVQWSIETISARAVKATKPAWGGSARMLKNSIECAMIEHGKLTRPFGIDGHEMKAVPHDKVRAEFYRSYPAETQAAKNKQFNRLIGDALARGLIASREIAGIDWVWIVKDEPTEQS